MRAASGMSATNLVELDADEAEGPGFSTRGTFWYLALIGKVFILSKTKYTQPKVNQRLYY